MMIDAEELYDAVRQERDELLEEIEKMKADLAQERNRAEKLATRLSAALDWVDALEDAFRSELAKDELEKIRAFIRDTSQALAGDFRKRKAQHDEQRTRCEECSSEAMLTPCSQCLRDVCDGCFEQIGMCNRCQADF